MKRSTLYVDMDNTLVDFASALPKLSPELLATYPERDEIPGIFALMDPMPGAVEAVIELARWYDLYVLSTAPWNNPSAWQDKVRWIKRHFGDGPDSVLYKRLILSHHKHLARGDVLVDDRPWANGAAEFVGRVVHFGPEGAFATWPEVVDLLRSEERRVGTE